MKQPNYKFYPSLLDSFQSYLDAEVSWEQFFGMSEEPSTSLEAWCEQKYKDLIDRINRVPFTNEAVERGSCLNEIVDCLVGNVASTRDDISIHKRDTYVSRQGLGVIGECGKVEGGDVVEEEIPLPHIEAVMNGNAYLFDIAFCKRLAAYFRNGLTQVYTYATLPTKYGDVGLYGFVDYVCGNKVCDLKTTSRYEFGKYRKGWQQHVYPWALTESGMCEGIRSFEYTAAVLKGGNRRSLLITGEVFPEVYVYDHDVSTMHLRNVCEAFIEFINNNKEQITDTKIFGGKE